MAFIKKNGSLIDISLSSSNLWLLYKNDQDILEMKTVPLVDNNITPEYLILCDDMNNFKMRTDCSNRYHDSDDLDSQNQQIIPLTDDYDEYQMIQQYKEQLDAKEIYLKLIFEPFKFSKLNIIKTLSIFQSNDESKMIIKGSNEVNKEKLKEVIIRAVESEVEMDQVNNEEDFIQNTWKHWSKFYSMLKQYDCDSKSPIGLFVDGTNESLVCLIRKSSVSLFTKADLAQCYHSCQSINLMKLLSTNNSMSIQNSDLRDITLIMETLLAINIQINNRSHHKTNYKIENESKGCNLTTNSKSTMSTIDFINNLIDNSAFKSDEFIIKFCSSLNKISNLDKLKYPFEIIFKYFDMNDLHFGSSSTNTGEMETNFIENASKLMPTITSDFTVNSMLISFRNLITRRYDFLCNFCVLINIIHKFNDKLEISLRVADEIKQKFYEPSIKLLHSYEYLKWLNDLYPIYINKSLFDKNIRRTIDLYSNISETTTTIKDYNDILLKNFISSSYGQRSVLYLRPLTGIHLFENLINTLIKFMWPQHYDDFDFVKYLLANLQYTHLDSYCHQLKWSSRAKNLRLFLLGQSCLFTNDIDKSIDLFIKASINLENDKVLTRFINLNDKKKKKTNQHRNKMLNRSTIIKNDKPKYSIISNPMIGSNIDVNSSPSLMMSDETMTMEEDEYENEEENEEEDSLSKNKTHLLLDYYTKIIHYFDLNGNSDASIELIHKALSLTQFDSNSQSRLQCILFKSYMDLDYLDEAHKAIMFNKNHEWQKNCLKEFISDLANGTKQRSNRIVSFKYDYNLDQFVIKLLNRRAEQSDLNGNVDFYRLICSMHTKRKDFKRAATSMYECYQRLRNEQSGSVRSIERQEKCLLIALNSLQLLADPKQRWITIDNNKTIIELNEIKKDYMIVSNMRLLAENSSASTVAMLYNVDELISLLVKNVLFDRAIILCLAFYKIETSPLTSIFIGLVDVCCRKSNFYFNFINLILPKFNCF
jgi:hypothetical protein